MGVAVPVGRSNREPELLVTALASLGAVDFGSRWCPVQFYEFGDPASPTLMLLHGADTTWDRHFGDAIPTLAERFHVIAVGTSGFDPADDGDYESAAVEAERIVAYVRDHLGGRLDGLYSCSFGATAAFYIALDRRIEVGGIVLDGLWSIDTGLLTPFTARLEGPLDA